MRASAFEDTAHLMVRDNNVLLMFLYVREVRVA